MSVERDYKEEIALGLNDNLKEGLRRRRRSADHPNAALYPNCSVDDFYPNSGLISRGSSNPGGKVSVKWKPLKGFVNKDEVASVLCVVTVRVEDYFGDDAKRRRGVRDGNSLNVQERAYQTPCPLVSTRQLLWLLMICDLCDTNNWPRGIHHNKSQISF